MTVCFLRFGRRTMLLVSYVFAALFGVASAFSTSLVMFAVLRFFTGFSITGIVIIAAVLSEYFTLTTFQRCLSRPQTSIFREKPMN